MAEEGFRASKGQSETLGLPLGYKVYSAFPFAAINQKDSKYAIDDKEFVWLENVFRQGAGFLRAAPDKGAPIYTAPLGKTIVYFFFFNIGDTDYCAVFLSDGTAVQVRMSDFSITSISNVPNTFYQGSSLPACVQWGALYLAIANNNTVDDYWVWDGSVLYGTGTLSPEVTMTSGGSGYSTPPTVTFFGGSGSGAAGTAIISNGQVVNVQITNQGSGYLPGDIVQLVFTGGGSDNGAKLQAVLAAGFVTAVLMGNHGTGYTSRPGITFTGGGGGVGAAGHPILAPTQVTSATVGAGGAGYTFANVIFSGGGGGAGAAATANLTAGAVVSITMTDFGSGYTDVPTITITGDGAGATGIAHLAPTSVDAVVVDAPGSGYTSSPAVNFIGGGGAGATALSTLSSSSVASVTVIDGGSGFTTTPILEIVGGGGSGAEATATLTGGVITSVTVTNGGSGYTSVPTVLVDAGANNAATGTVNIMPFGVNGNALETYQSRIWVFHPKNTGSIPQSGQFRVSAPESLTNFSLAEGSLIFTSTDSNLRKQYTNAIQSNGYLYPIGDSSVYVISNVQTQGDPVLTTFNYQNVDPQIATSFRDTVQALGQTILFTNKNGVFALRGGSVAKASEKLDNLFDTAKFPPTGGALAPSSAVAYVHNVRYFASLLTITDPFTGLARNVMVMTDEKGWYVGTQTSDLKFIGSQIVDSNEKAYGTDGRVLIPLFTTPSNQLQKVIVTKQYGAQAHFIVKQVWNITLHGEAFGGSDAAISVVVNTEEGNFMLPYVADLSTPKVFTGPVEDTFGAFIGLTLATVSPDFALYNMSIGYSDVVGPLGAGKTNAPIV
jgi:hypothetical protein